MVVEEEVPFLKMASFGSFNCISSIVVSTENVLTEVMFGVQELTTAFLYVAVFI